MYAAVALVLLIVAVLLVAGCVSQGSDNQNQTLTKEKYVFLEQQTNWTWIPISGSCHPLNPGCYGNPSSPYTFEEKNRVLSVTGYREQKGSINDSFILFYGREHHDNFNLCDNYNTGIFLYSLPGQFNNVTIESVMENGTVALRYDDVPIILKPKERWENSTRKITGPWPLQPKPTERLEDQTHGKEGEVIFIDEEPLTDCTAEIVTTNRIYNAGVFEKNSIVFV